MKHDAGAGYDAVYPDTWTTTDIIQVRTYMEVQNRDSGVDVCSAIRYAAGTVRISSVSQKIRGLPLSSFLIKFPLFPRSAYPDREAPEKGKEIRRSCATNYTRVVHFWPVIKLFV